MYQIEFSFNINKMNRNAAIKSEKTGLTYEVRPIRSDGFLVFIIVSAFLTGAFLFLLTPGLSINGRKYGFNVLPYFPTMAIVGSIWLAVTAIAVYGIIRLNKRDKLIRLLNQVAEDSPGDNNVKISYLDDLSDYLNLDMLAKEFPRLRADLEVTAKMDDFKARMNRLDLEFYSNEGKEGLSTLDVDERVALKNVINNQYEELSKEIVTFPGLNKDLLKAKKSINRIKKKLKPQAPARTPPKLPLRARDLPGENTRFKLTVEQLLVQPQISNAVARKGERIETQNRYRENATAAAERAGKRITLRWDKDGAIYSGPRKDADRKSLSREPIQLRKTNMVARRPPSGFNYRPER